MKRCKKIIEQLDRQRLQFLRKEARKKRKARIPGSDESN